MKSKRLISMLCAAAVLLSFSACGSESENVSEEETSSEVTSSSEETTEMTESYSVTEESKAPPADTAGAIDELNSLVAEDVENTISALNAEYEQLKSEIDTYSKYLSNTDKMKAFYTKVYNTNYSLCVRMCEYSLDYAEAIIASDMDADDKYDELEELYDNIYDDAGEEIYDGIYDGILDDMYDDFYDGILDEAYDNNEYSDYNEWSDALSDEYKLWSDTRSDVYSDWSDMRSDIYDFWSDIRSKVWNDDIEKAEKRLEDFREDIEKLKEDAVQTESSDTSDIETDTPEKTPPAENLADGMRPEFKEALDSYETFFDEYCDFMKKYNESPDDLSLLTEYTEYMTRYLDTMDKMNKLNDGELNDEELKYYLQVTNRINEKLLDASL